MSADILLLLLVAIPTAVLFGATLYGLLLYTRHKSARRSRRFYILDTRSCVGNDALWWGRNRKGYTCSIDEAGLYSQQEAEDIHACRASDVPVPKEIVDRNISRTVRVDVEDMRPYRHAGR